MSELKTKIYILLSMIWTLFTLAIVAWWIVFTVNQIERVRNGERLQSEVYEQQEKMIKAEGGVLLILLISGGMSLVAVVWKLHQQNQKIREFFSIFTHEIKTSLARLILRSDLLAEENPGITSFQEFKEETLFLENQLENALWVAKGFGSLFLEKIIWSELLREFESSSGKIKCHIEGDSFEVRMDRRIFQMIFRNLIQNSLDHGHANQFFIHAEKDESYWKLNLEDNGEGYHGDFERLGCKMERVNSKSKSGIGLWVVRQGIQRLGGKIHFYKNKQNGFGTEIIIPLSVQTQIQS